MKRSIFLFWAATVAVGCHHPPAHRQMHPGPGVGGPGPGVMMNGPAGPQVSAAPVPVQVFFAGPDGMQVAWESGEPGNFSPPQITAPGRYNFAQGNMYRLKVSGIPDRPGMELYPTMEIAPPNPKTTAFLSHNPVPMGFSQEDIDQILAGNYVTKAVFLPDPEHQELAIAGVETLVSTRLEPGADPLLEADRRGTLLAVIRAGNIDLEMPGDAMSMATPPGAVVQAAGFHTVTPASMALAAGEAAAPPYGSPLGPPPGPQYGIPISGTPIGLPGPPHVPLGGPAGLKKHVMRNHTFRSIPGPTEKMDITVTHVPGISVPRPVKRIKVLEVNKHLHNPF